ALALVSPLRADEDARGHDAGVCQSARPGREPLAQRRCRRLAHELDLVAALADDAAAVVVERERALDDRAEVAPARRLFRLARRAHGAERRRARRQDASLVLHDL